MAELVVVLARQEEVGAGFQSRCRDMARLCSSEADRLRGLGFERAALLWEDSAAELLFYADLDRLFQERLVQTAEFADGLVPHPRGRV